MLWKITTYDNIWNNSYLNKKSFLISGPMLFEPAIGTSVSLLLVWTCTKSLLIASISPNISNAFSFEPSGSRIFWISDSIKEVVISVCWSLSQTNLKIKSSFSSSPLAVLAQKGSDLFKILLHSLSWRKVVFFKRKKKPINWSSWKA